MGMGMGERWVEEGPVELKDAPRVSVEVGTGEPSPGDAEIIWDDAPGEAAPPAGRNQVGGRSAPDGDEIAESRREAAAGDPAAVPKVRRRRKPQEDRLVPRPPNGRSGSGGGTAALPAGARQAAAARSQDRAALEPRERAEPPAKTRRRSLNRWLILLVPLIVVATVAWRLRQQRLRESPLIVEKGRSEGIPALDEGNFDRANQLLSAAKSAVNALGGDVEEADTIRHAADEAAIFVDLIPETLEQLLADAGRTDAATWESRFGTLYKGRSIFIDSSITVAPSPGTTSLYQILYRVLPPGEASNFRDGKSGRPDRVGVIDLTGFKLFEQAQPSVGNRVIFGARLASFKYDVDKDSWLIGLQPDSGVFITHTKALGALGYRTGPDVDTTTERGP